MTALPTPRRLPIVPAPTRTRVGKRPLERCGPADLFHDYVLDPYPPRAPVAEQLRSVSLLHEAFALTGVEDEGAALIDTVRRELGPFRTVFGVKHQQDLGVTGFELYFYDFGRVHPDLSIERMQEILAPHVALSARPRRAIPWHMFSVELTAEDLRKRASVPAHVYVDMRSYLLSDDSLTMENVYTFHDPRREIEHVLHRLRASLHTDLSPRALAELIPPALFRCHRLCVANKRTADAVYFSRVPTAAMLGFLRARAWPAPLVAMVESHADEFEHLFWCLGMDFTQSGESPVISKSGVYGSF